VDANFDAGTIARPAGQLKFAADLGSALAHAGKAEAKTGLGVVEGPAVILDPNANKVFIKAESDMDSASAGVLQGSVYRLLRDSQKVLGNSGGQRERVSPGRKCDVGTAAQAVAVRQFANRVDQVSAVLERVRQPPNGAAGLFQVVARQFASPPKMRSNFLRQTRGELIDGFQMQKHTREALR
jgi:hypothetical protein